MCVCVRVCAWLCVCARVCVFEVVGEIEANIRGCACVRTCVHVFECMFVCVPYYKEMYESLFNKRIKQYYCKFNNDFKPKFQTVINVKHTGAVLGQLMTQYQFDLNKKLVY